MNKLTEIQKENKNLISEKQKNKLDTIKNILSNKTIEDFSENDYMYDVVLLSKIWYEYVSTIILKGIEDHRFSIEFVELDYYSENYINKNPKIFEDLDNSLNFFLKLLTHFRNDPDLILSVLECFPDYFNDFEKSNEFHSDLEHVFDLSGLMFSEKLTKNNTYLKKTILAEQIFSSIGLGTIFEGFKLDDEFEKDQEHFVLQNLSFNFFIFNNLLIFMNEEFRISNLIELSKNIKNWKNKFDNCIETINNFTQKLISSPILLEDEIQLIYKKFDDINFEEIERWTGNYFDNDYNEIDFDEIDSISNNNLSYYSEYFDCLEFLNVIKSFCGLENYSYQTIFESLLNFCDLKKTFEFGADLRVYTNPVDVQVRIKKTKDSTDNSYYPLFIFDNEYMKENFTLTEQKQFINFSYDSHGSVILSDYFLVKTDNFNNLEFVKEALRHNFLLFNCMPILMRKNTEIYSIAIDQGVKFLDNEGVEDYLIDDILNSYLIKN